MAFELSMGFAVIIVAMLVHLLATILIVAVIRPLEPIVKSRPYLFIAFALIVTNLILFTAHLTGVALWSSLYVFLGLTDSFPDAFYSAFIMNTTLGLGGIAPEIDTRLLAPLTASSGVMMISWSSALIIYVVQTYLPHVARRG